MKSTFFILITLISGQSLASLDDAMDLSQFDEVDAINPKLVELRSRAVSTGMYHGYVNEVENISTLLERRSVALDGAYNFRNLLIGDNLLPPVVVKGKSLYENLSKSKYKEASMIYRVRRGSVVSYNSPTWRDYLYLSSFSVDKPVLLPGMKPKKSNEINAWKDGVSDGYKKGIEHARELFSYQFAKLNEEFTGMALALKLQEKGMISFSDLTTSKIGTVVSDKAININESVTSLNVRDIFNAKDDWTPIIQITNLETGDENE